MNQKNTKKIVIISLLILGSIALILITKPSLKTTTDLNPAASLNSAIQLDEKFYDFGTISMARGRVSHLFKIRNAGSENEIIKTMYTSCMCTIASLIDSKGTKFGPFGMPGHGFLPEMNKSLDPDEEATIEVVFDPAAHGPAGVGEISRTVYLNFADKSQSGLSFSAVVIP